MSKVKCFDVLMMVLERMKDEKNCAFEPDACKIALLENECAALDRLADQSDATGFEVDVDEDSGKVTISLDVAFSLAVVRSDRSLLQLFEENTKSFSINKTDVQDIIRLTFVFESLWA